MATRHILAELADAFTTSTGVAASVVSVGGVDAARRIRDGETFDLAVLAADALAKLADEGFVAVDSLQTFAWSPAAVAVRSDAARPPTCDAASIRSLVGRAGAVGLSTGPSGAAVRAILAAWNCEDGRATRIVEAPPGVPVARLIASGTVDVGFQQWSEMIGEPGIDIVGVVPETLLPKTRFSIGLCRAAPHVASADAFVACLTSVAAGLVKRRHGMEPGT